MFRVKPQSPGKRQTNMRCMESSGERRWQVKQFAGRLRGKRAGLRVLAYIIGAWATFFLLRAKRKKMARMEEIQEKIDGLREILFQIDEGVDECLTYLTRKEQNECFADITDIPNLVPIRMSEMTAVFLYTKKGTNLGQTRAPAPSAYPAGHSIDGDALDSRAPRDSGKDAGPGSEKGGRFIIKRIIIKQENHPEEEKISLVLNNKYLMRTYFTYKTAFRNYKNVEQEILWLFSEYLTTKISHKEIDRNEDRIRTILKDVVEGLRYMHSRGIAHLDLKMANIMGEYSPEDKRMVYKIIDFGFSRMFKRGAAEAVFPGRSYGTFPYKAPEVCNENIHGFTSDIWCVGAMALFMSDKGSGVFQKKDSKRAGANKKDYEKFKKFLQGTVHIPIPRTASPELVDFIRWCMQRDRHLRPTAGQLASHPFLTNQGLPLAEVNELAELYFV